MSDVCSLDAARAALAAGNAFLATVGERMAMRAAVKERISTERMDDMQLAVYEYAFAVTGLRVAAAMLDYAASRGDTECRMAILCTAEALSETRTRLQTRPDDFGIDTGSVAATFEAPSLQDFLARDLAAAR